MRQYASHPDCHAIGWHTIVEGTLKQVVHLWRYESQADREARRASMAADRAWGDYLPVSEEAGLLVSQKNRILKPTDFCPLNRRRDNHSEELTALGVGSPDRPDGAVPLFLSRPPRPLARMVVAGHC